MRAGRACRGDGEMGTGSSRDARQQAEDVVLKGPSFLARLLLELDEQWPALRFMGFGLYYAWIWLCYDSTTLIDADIRTNAGTTFAMYIASTLALSVMLIAAALMHGASRRLVSSKAFVATAAVLVGAATVGVRVFSANGASDVLFLLSSVVTGLGTAWVCLRVAVEYASVPSRASTLHAAATFILAALMYFLVRGLPEGLGLAVMALLPLAATLCTMTPAGEAPMEDEPQPHAHLLPRGFFFRLVFAIAVFSAVSGVTRGYSALTQATSVLDDRGCLVVFGTAVASALLFALVGGLGNDFDVSRLYYPVIILASVGILIMPLVDAPGQASGVFVGIAYTCFIMIVWCLLAQVSHVTGVSPVRVFGMGRGASALGTTAGWALGSFLAGSGTLGGDAMFAVSCAMVLALLVVSMLVFNDRAMGSVLRMVGRQAAQDARAAAAGVRCEGAGGSVDATGPASALEPAGMAGPVGPASAACAPGAVPPDEGADASAVPAAQVSGERAGTGSWSRSCREISSRFGLSAREEEVLFLLAKGRTISFVADELGVSFNTAKSHIRHVYVKIGVHTRSELLDLVEQGRAK